MRIQAPASGNLAQLDAMRIVFQLALQRLQGQLDLLDVLVEHLGQRQRTDRLVGHEQQRLERRGQMLQVDSLKHIRSSLYAPAMCQWGLSLLAHHVAKSSSSLNTSSPDPSM